MARKRWYKTEEIIEKLREVEILLSQGQTVQQAIATRAESNFDSGTMIGGRSSD